MNPLRRIFENSAYLPPSIQDRLATDISNVGRKMWEAAGKPNGSPGEYFARHPEARERVFQEPSSQWIPWAERYKLNIGASYTVDGTKRDTPVEFLTGFAETAREVRNQQPADIAQMLENALGKGAEQALRKTQTVGDLAEILARSTLGAQVSNAARRGLLGSPDVQTMLTQSITGYMGVRDRLLEYVPPEQGGKGNLMAFAAGRAGQGAISTEERAELNAFPYGTISHEALDDAGEHLQGQLEFGITAANLDLGGYAMKDIAGADPAASIRQHSEVRTATSNGLVTTRQVVDRGIDAWGPGIQTTKRTKNLITLSEQEHNERIAADQRYSQVRMAEDEAYAAGYDQRLSPSQLEIARKDQAILQGSARQYPSPLYTREAGSGWAPLGPTRAGKGQPRQVALTPQQIIEISKNEGRSPEMQGTLDALDAEYRQHTLANSPTVTGDTLGGKKTGTLFYRNIQGGRIGYGTIFQMPVRGEQRYFMATGRPYNGRLNYEYLAKVGEDFELPKYHQNKLPSTILTRFSRNLKFQNLGGGGVDVDTSNMVLAEAEDARRNAEGNYRSLTMDTRYQAGRLVTLDNQNKFAELPDELTISEMRMFQQSEGYKGNLPTPEDLGYEAITEEYFKGDGPYRARTHREAEPIKRELVADTIGYKRSSPDVGEENKVLLAGGEQIFDERRVNQLTENLASLESDEAQRSVARSIFAQAGSPLAYQSAVGRKMALQGRVGRAIRSLNKTDRTLLGNANAAGLKFLESVGPNSTSNPWRRRLMRERAPSIQAARASGGSLAGTLAVPEGARAQAQEWTDKFGAIAEELTGEATNVALYTGQFAPGARLTASTMGFYRQQDDTVYFTGNLFDPETVAARQNEIGDFDFADSQFKIGLHEIGHRMETKEVLDTIQNFWAQGGSKVKGKISQYLEKAKGTRGNMTPDQLKHELAAEMYAEAQGFPSPMAKELLTDRERAQLAGMAGKGTRVFAGKGEAVMPFDPPMPEDPPDDFDDISQFLSDDGGPAPKKRANVSRSKDAAGGGNGNQPPVPPAPPAPPPEGPKKPRRKAKAQQAQPTASAQSNGFRSIDDLRAMSQEQLFQEWQRAAGLEGADDPSSSAGKYNTQISEVYAMNERTGGQPQSGGAPSQRPSERAMGSSDTAAANIRRQGEPVGMTWQNKLGQLFRDEEAWAYAVESGQDTGGANWRDRARQNAIAGAENIKANAPLLDKPQSLREALHGIPAFRANPHLIGAAAQILTNPDPISPTRLSETNITARDISERLSSVNLDDLANIDSEMLGNPEYTDAAGNRTAHDLARGVRYRRKDRTGVERTTLSENNMAALQAKISEAGMLAGQGPLSDDPKVALKTLKERMMNHIKGWLNGITKDMEQGGTDPDEMLQWRETKEKIQSAAYKLVGAQVSKLDKDFGLRGAGDTKGWESIQAVHFRSVEQMERELEGRPSLRDKIVSRHGSLAQAAKGPYDIYEDDGTHYATGQIPSLGGGKGGREGKWGGGAGSFLYGAYIAKRMLAMTVGPSLQEAEYYAGKVMEPMGSVAAVGDGTPLSQQIGGTATRASLVRDRMARGAWEQWAGVTDAMYGISGHYGGLPRTMSGLGAAGGIAGLGALAGSSMAASLGLEGPMVAAGGGLLTAVGAVMADQTIQNELYNISHPGEAPRTIGTQMQSGIIDASLYLEQAKTGLPGLALSGYQFFGDRYQQAMSSTLMQSIFPANKLVGPQVEKFVDTAETGFRRLFDIPTRDELIKRLPQEMQDLIAAKERGETEGEKSIRELAEDIKSTTSEEYGELAPGLKAIARLTGGIPGREQQIKDLVSRGYTSGYQGRESLARVANIAEQYGIRPGQGGDIFDRLSKMDEAQLVEEEGRAGRVSQYGSTLAGYFTSTRNAQRFVDQNNILTQAGAQGVQALLSPAAMFGLTGESVVGQTVVPGTMGAMQPVTLSQKAAELSRMYGPYKSTLAGDLSFELQKRGVGAVEAMGAFGALGYQNEAQLGIGKSWLSQAQMFGSTANPMDIAAAAVRQTPWQSQVLGGIAQQFSVMSNMDMGMAQQMFSGMGLSNNQTWMLQRMAGGDLSAWSQNARMTGNMAGNFLNNAGMPIYTTSLRGMIGLNNAQMGNPYALNLTGFSEQKAAGLMTGLWDGNAAGYDQEALDTWVNQGQIGRQRLHMTRMNSFQNRGLALQQAQADASWEYQQDSWALQDQGRAIQYGQQQEEFGAQYERMQAQHQYAAASERIQGKRMELGNQFAIRQENLSWQRMQTQHQFAERQEDLSYRKMMTSNEFAIRGEELGWKRIELQEQFGGKVAQLGRERMMAYHENQLWGLQFSHQTEQMQRQFTQQQWGYQDVTRSLQYGWQTEDVNEAIRFATGRERRQLIKQRDRSTMMHGLEEQNIEDTRSQQEKMWAREDERYQKQEEFLNHIIDLDKQQYEIAEEQRIKSIELSKEEFKLGVEQREAMLALNLEDFNLGIEQRKAYKAIDEENWKLNREQRQAMHKLDEKNFDLQRRHRTEMQRMDERDHDRRMSNFEEVWAHQQKTIDREREYQTLQRTFQLAQLKLQQDMNRETQSYNREMDKVTTLYQLQAGYFQEMLKNDPSSILLAIKELGATLGNVSQSTMNSFSSAIQAIARLDAYTLDQLTEAIISMK